jgi:hypothetical protein
LPKNTKFRVAVIGLGIDFLPDLSAALADARVEGVILCTPHTQHGAQMIQAGKAGKHIFCEKPLALHRSEMLAAMAAMAASNARVLRYETAALTPLLFARGAFATAVLPPPVPAKVCAKT